MTQKLTLISWNVNGLRAAVKKGFFDAFHRLNPDILGIQETKLQQAQLTQKMRQIEGYDSHWSFCTHKKGYSGVGVYTRIPPQSVRHGIKIARFDDEGRILEMDLGAFIYFNIYFPNGGMSDARLQYKLDFYQAFFEHADAYRKAGRSLVISGDYNTAHNAIDLKNPKANEKVSGFLRIERDWLDRLVEKGYVDTFRHFHPNTEKYSWWSYRTRARARNAGWRIDYVFVTQDLIENNQVQEAFIDNDIHGSDHCPVGLTLEI